MRLRTGGNKFRTKKTRSKWRDIEFAWDALAHHEEFASSPLNMSLFIHSGALSHAGESKAVVKAPLCERKATISWNGHTQPMTPKIEQQARGMVLRDNKGAFRDHELTQAKTYSNLIPKISRVDGPLVALWILGPSAVGKTTVSEMLLDRLIPTNRGNCVVIDGAIFRLFHGGYAELRQNGILNECVWSFAYSLIKKAINNAKFNLMMSVAAVQKQHLLIPHTCVDKNECLGGEALLQKAGYRNDIASVTVPPDEKEKEKVVQRGHNRSLDEGKVYNEEQWNATMRAIEPMEKVRSGCKFKFKAASSKESLPSLEGCDASPDLTTCPFAVCEALQKDFERSDETPAKRARTFTYADR